jgi:hypothetical protein
MRAFHAAGAIALIAIPLCTHAGGIVIGNRVWVDLDADGLQDAGEPGAAGVTVQLWNPARTVMLASTTTSALGNYSVVAAGPGDYRMRFLRPLGTDSFSPVDVGVDEQVDSDVHSSRDLFGFTEVLTLAPNLISTTVVDAGLIRAPIGIGNRVWNDYDGDGLQAPDEPGLVGYTVRLTNAAKDVVYDSAVTVNDGVYQLHAPGPGAYRVRLVSSAPFPPKNAGDDALDSEINPTEPDRGYTDVLQISVGRSDIDAGLMPYPIAVGNRVWNDADRDGLQDAAEAGRPDVAVQLWNAERTIMFDAAVTSATGIYSLHAPGPGQYRVRVVVPDGMAPTLLDAGADDQLDSDGFPDGIDIGYTTTLTFAPNLISTTINDFGLLQQRVFSNGFEGDALEPPARK